MSESEISAAPDPDQEPAQAVIAAFGGIRPTAHKLGVAVSTVQGWKERGTIPRSRHAEILVAAQTHEIDLDPDLLAASDQTQAPTIEGEAASLGAEAAPAASRPEQSERPQAEPKEEAAAPAPAPAASGPGDGPKRPPPGAASRDTPTDGPADGPPSPDDGERAPPRWLARLSPQLPAAALGATVLAAGFLLAMGTSDLWLGRDGGDVDAVDPALVAALQQRIETLEAQAGEAGSGGGLSADEVDRIAGTLLAAVDERYEQRVRSNEEAANRLEGALGDLRERLDALAGRIDALPLDGQEGGAALQRLGETLARVSGDLAALQETVAGLRSRLDALPESAATGAGGDPGRTAALQGALDDLTARIGALEGELAARDEALAERLADLEAQLAAAEGALDALPDPDEHSGAAAALALAATDLKEAVTAGRPYADALAVLARLVGGESGFAGALDALRPAAESGVHPLSRLQRDLEAVAAEIVRADDSGAGDDWFDSLLDDVSGLVSVRPVGEVEGETTAARVARAESRLAAGDLPAAVEEIAALEGQPAALAAPWLEAARARLAALEAAERVMSLALERLASGG